ncbi:multiple epidermal growth factor-like domains protein 11 [Haliotis rufescens]|uniref:multiple epidermal growth factor-like domains protein 11 n=1 Tax=Haliotis rufescens TaxID=6454 RepID=UPI00201E9BC1|nr:multiple epidermal growth factor-like domains protein 11 [Haliotis rufescens]
MHFPDNVARNHATSSNGDSFPSSRATDGSNAAHGYTVRIETNPSNPSWWRVDLNDTVLIREVTIYFRTDYRPRRNGIKVYSTNSTDVPSGDNCYNVIGRSDGSWIPDVTRAPCSGMGRYILLYTTVHNDGDTSTSLPVLDFCEVDVDVCGPGTFGSDCDNYCHCDGDVCNYVSGVCPSGICMSGWGSDSCDTGCVQGVQYGAGCVGNCSARMCEGGSGTCPRETDRCEDGCQSGWEGMDCIHGMSV